MKPTPAQIQQALLNTKQRPRNDAPAIQAALLRTKLKTPQGQAAALRYNFDGSSHLDREY